MSVPESNNPLLDLFREEAATHARTLLEVLSGWGPETGPDAAEAASRAAHSLKGAARVVSLAPAAELAGALERRFERCKDHPGEIAQDEVPAIEEAVHWLTRMAEHASPDFETWFEAHAPAVAEAQEAVLAQRDGRVSETESETAAPESAPPSKPGESSPSQASVDPPTAPDVQPPAGIVPLDATLLELFREEVQSNVDILNAGLVELEQAPAETERIEPLMRAAHSVKGAARVAELPLVVQLAHAMEECLVAAQESKIVLASNEIDRLLEGVDLLGQLNEAGDDLGGWIVQHADEFEVVRTRLAAILSGEPGPEPPVAKPVSPAAPVVKHEETSSPTPPSTPVDEKPAEKKGSKSSTSGGEAVVRVSARSLTRLMGLAGEALVEARWLQPFSNSLLDLKRRQREVEERLEELEQIASAPDAAERSNQIIQEAREQVEACQLLVAERIQEFDDRWRQADDLNSRLYNEVIASRMRPFGDGMQGFPRMTRDVARQLGKSLRLNIRGESTDVDRDILEKLDAPLNHILRNAIDHGLEMPEERLAAGKPEVGQITIEARHSAGMLVVTVQDDGRGIDVEKLRARVVDRGLTTEDLAARMSHAELLEFVFLPGFSTACGVTEVSGRGVGLDVVRNMAHSVGGNVRIETEQGRGTKFYLELPITLSVIRAVLAKVAGEPYAFPHNRIDRLIQLPAADLHSLENRQYIEINDRNVGLVTARQVFDLEGESPQSEDVSVILFGDSSRQYGVVVDAFLGEHDLVVRPLDPRLGKVPDINAAAILDDGTPVLIVDLDDMRRSIEKLLHGTTLRRANEGGGENATRRARRILVVDDSITVREVQRQLLSNQGYEVEVAVDGVDGWNQVRHGKFDLVISDVDMPRMGGIDFVRHIKEDSRLRSMPVIIVSYKDREEDRLKGLEVGANYYLTKSSFHDETLLDAVRELIGDAVA